jgi:hypothetical protein
MPNETTTAVAQVEDSLDKYGDKAVANRNATDTGIITPVSAWLQFVWAKTQNDDTKQAVLKAGGSIPTFVLNRAGFLFPLKPFMYHLVEAVTIATKNDDSGKVIDAAESLPKFEEGDPERGRWAEHTYAVVLAVVGGTLIPAGLNLRSGSRHAFRNAITTLKDAAKPDWAGKGEAFKVTAAATGMPMGRFLATGSCRPEKNSKSGRMQLIGSCSVSVASPDELTRFNNAMNDRQFRADLRLVETFHAKKLRDLLGGGIAEPEESGSGE